MEKLTKKSFARSEPFLPLPYLLILQKDAWDNFWERDLKELLEEISPIRDYNKKEFELWFSDYKLGEPKYESDVEAKKNNASFEAPLTVKAKLVNLKTKEIKEQEIFLCDFPIQTERGTFIVNGVERVAISQLIRSPGAFLMAIILVLKSYPIGVLGWNLRRTPPA
jgi:DNA-directed RNA polymerase subunit beta